MDFNLEPEMQFQVCCITLLVLALITSVKEADVSGSIAVLGLVAKSVSSHQLMQTVRSVHLVIYSTPQPLRASWKIRFIPKI